MAFVQSCINDTKHWMVHNNLQEDADQTEMILIGNKQKRGKVNNPEMSIGVCVITLTDDKAVRNIGSWFDERINMKVHVEKVCQLAYMEIWNTDVIRKYSNQTSTANVVHAFVLSRIY